MVGQHPDVPHIGQLGAVLIGGCRGGLHSDGDAVLAAGAEQGRWQGHPFQGDVLVHVIEHGPAIHVGAVHPNHYIEVLGGWGRGVGVVEQEAQYACGVGKARRGHRDVQLHDIGLVARVWPVIREEVAVVDVHAAGAVSRSQDVRGNQRLGHVLCRHVRHEVDLGVERTVVGSRPQGTDVGSGEEA